MAIAVTEMPDAATPSASPRCRSNAAISGRVYDSAPVPVPKIPATTMSNP